MVYLVVFLIWQLGKFYKDHKIKYAPFIYNASMAFFSYSTQHSILNTMCNNFQTFAKNLKSVGHFRK